VKCLRIGIIGVPSSIGARSMGQEKAPTALREAKLVERLREAGHEVADYGDTKPFHFSPDLLYPKAQNKFAVINVCRLVAGRVEQVLRYGYSPHILGGDCTIAIGALAGIVNLFPSVGLLYFDGDADSNTPETTTTGILDGMVIAHIVGKGDRDIACLAKRYPILPEENVVLFGLNLASGYVDPPEVEFLRNSSIEQFSVKTIREIGVETAARQAMRTLSSRAEFIFVHFDVDVIDSNEMPAADLPHKFGLSLNEVERALRVFMQSSNFLGIEVTEFNAEKDEGRQLAITLADMIVQA